MISRVFSIPCILWCHDECFHSNMSWLHWFATTNIRLGNDLSDNWGIGFIQGSFQIHNQALVVSFFTPTMPRDFSCSTTTCCVHHGFRQTFDTWNFGRIPQLWNRHIRLQTRLHKLHLIYTFLGKNSPWLTHESAWQNSHCYGTICQATILWVFFSLYLSSYSLHTISLQISTAKVTT